MSTKDFKKGIEAGAKPFEAKFEQQAKAMERTSKKLEDGMDKISGTMDAIIDDMSAVEKKRLYDLNTQYDIKEMEDYEKELLLAGLITLAGDDANENQQSYIRSVKKYLGIKNPQTNIDLSGIENIENLTTQKALYQTFGEFLFLANENDSFLDEKEYFLDYFSVKNKDRTAILDCIHQIYKSTGALGLCEKYGFVPKQIEIKTSSGGPGKLEMMVIDAPVDIESGKEETYSGQNIRLLADINCKGKLTFEYCVIIYNSAKLSGKIIADENGEITLSNCVIVDSNKAKLIDENPGQCGEDCLFSANNKNKLAIENSLLYDCRQFGTGFTFNISNSIIRYSNMPIALRKKSQGSLSSFLQTLTGTSVSSFISLLDVESKISHCLIENINTNDYSVMCKNADIGTWSSEEKLADSSPLFRNFNTIENSTFRNFDKCLYGFQLVKDCVFENCLNAITDGNIVVDSLFRNCKDVVGSITSVERCQFIECNDEIINGSNNEGSQLEITGCTFYNITSKRYIIQFYHNGGTHVLHDCLFDGLHTSSDTAIHIWPGINQSKPVSIENCEFLHCANEHDDGEDFICYEYIETSGFMGKQEKTITNAIVKNCKGLDKINKEGNKAKEIKIRDKTMDGRPLGTVIDEGAVGIPSFDCAAIPASKPVLA
ncbi:hypothetical protein AGMMS49546_32790 [Spirochaetia bacterium]|nr:hypothetical protein AGMMS49546_32790 [Spirochaetia bacterium]